MIKKGHNKMYLHTKVDNEGAQALFEKAGYAEPTEAGAYTRPLFSST
jgi:ribosomal protein S18 acetylase RimI-like enzyme